MSIETSTRCSCGTYVVLSESQRVSVNGGWDAICPNCYGPVEDSSDAEKVLGWGKTPDAALLDWQEKHDDAHDVTLVVTDLFGELARQVSEESERQRGWRFEYACCLFHAGTTLVEVQEQVAEEDFPPDAHTNYVDYGPEVP